MRYIITPSQFHSLIYKYLEDMFSEKNFKKEINPYVKDGNTWRVEMSNDSGKQLLAYFWYGPGEDDDGNPHNGVGSLHIHYQILDSLRGFFGIRESKIQDIIADWVSETLNVDIDEISIHPHRNGTPNY
jgi:hypothetical protein